MTKLLRFVTVLNFFLIFNSEMAAAQELVKGKVTNTAGTGLSYATIKVFKDSTEVNSAVCDSLGYFTVKVNSEYVKPGIALQIQAYYLRTSSDRITVNTINDLIHITITGDTRSLSEVTVKGPVLLRKADRFIFTPGKALTDGSNAIELMRHTPLVRYDEKSDLISIIGKSGTIVYINNKKTEIPKEMLIAMLRSLPAENIKSIEIITNPGSEYAANTAGGIININIKRQIYEGWLGNLAVLTQQSVYNTTILNGAVNYRKGRLGLQLIPFVNNSFNYATSENTLDYTNGFEQKLDSRYFRRYLVLGGGLNVDYDINKSSFISYNGWFSDVSGKSNPSALTQFSTINQSKPDSFQNSLTNGRDTYVYNFGNLNYRKNLDSAEKSYLDLNFDYNDFHQRRKTDGVFNRTDENGNNLYEISRYRNDLPQSLLNLSGKAEYVRSLNNSTKVNAGVQYSNTTVDNNLAYFVNGSSGYFLDTDISNDYYYIEKYWAGFVNLTKNFNDKWNGNLGLRAEKTDYSTQERNLKISKDSNYINLFPSFGISYSPNQNNQFGLSLSRKIARPNIELLFPGRTWQSPNYFRENNPFLQPALYYNSELSYTLRNNYTFQLSWSHGSNSYSNFILPVNENNVTKFKSTYINYGVTNNVDLIVNLSQTLFKGFWEIHLTPGFNYSNYKSTTADVPANVTNYSYTIFYDNYFFLSRKHKWTAFATFKYNSRSRDITGRVLNSTSSLDLEVKKVIKNFSFFIIANDVYNGSSIIKSNLFANNLLSGNYLRSNGYNRSVLFQVRYVFGNRKLKTNKSRGSANDEMRNRASK